MQALPPAAFFLFLEAAAGGTIALFWVHLRGEVGRGYTLFTGASLWVAAALALWLRLAFPPLVDTFADRRAALWFSAERTATIALVVLLGAYLLGLRAVWSGLTRPLGRLVPLVALVALWTAAEVDPSPQLLGLGAPLAVLAGALALGSAIAALSLGHWYLVTPGLSVRPLVRLTLLCLAALIVQVVLLPAEVFLPGPPPAAVGALFGDYLLFLGVRVIFGLAVPLAATLLAWRTARIRSLDSATGLLYIVAALVLAGEIVARTLFFLTGVAT